MAEINLKSAKVLYEGSNSIIYYLEEKEEFETPVILKILKNEYPSLDQIIRFNNEYQLTKDLEIEGIRKAYKKEKIDGKYALYLEYFEGIALKKIFSEKERCLKACLKIAIQAAQALGEVHNHNIIHKDINSNNVLVNLDDYTIKIIDFGISSKIDTKIKDFEELDMLQGTLDYISPEQTGRTNKVVDYRSDLYSLGITLYELFTGQLPFHAEDLVELVHCHIAKHPKPLHEVNPDIPKVLSKIVFKLMSKNAEERYQSAFGLKSDLEKCLAQLEETGKVEDFEICQEDYSGKLHISTKIYGREEELQTLLEAFERVCDGKKEFVLVTGYSGVGKRAFVKEAEEPITQGGGYFISGEFQQFQEDIPYSGIVDAFENFVNHLLKESPEKLENWKERILRAVGTNGQVLIDLIPNLELIIGKQPPIKELGGKENQHRFNITFLNFIKVFCQPDHPLVLFIDNLQWADTASLYLIKVLLTDKNIHFFQFIGDYRKNEVESGHPLLKYMAEIKKEGILPEYIELQNLTRENVNSLVMDTLQCESEYAEGLTEILYEKTHGNPFFVREFLESLYEQGVLSFDYEQKMWVWDVDIIGAQEISDNVIELMTEKIKQLPEDTEKALQLAACIGHQLDLRVLSHISEKDLQETLNQVMFAVQEGFLTPLDENYKLISAGEEIEEDFQSRFEFIHNRIQQACYSLIPEADSKDIHFRLGQLYWSETPEEALEDRIFDIVNQINHGVHLIEEEEERIKLVRLNLKAAQKARNSTAYTSAKNYLSVARELLGENPWRTQYSLTRDIFIESENIACLSGNFEQMYEFAQQIKDRAKSIMGKVPAYEIEIEGYILQNRMSEAIRASLPILKLLGEEFPEDPNKFQVFMALLGVKMNLWGRDVEDLVALPEMEQPEKKALMKILNKVASAAYFSNQNFYALSVLKRINISLTYGNLSYSIVAYSSYGLILCGKFGKIEEGYGFGQLALKLLEKFDAKEFRCRVLVIINVFINHWKEHIKNTLQPLQEAHDVGIETGDLEYAGWAAFNYVENSFFIGIELGKLKRELQFYTDSMKQISQEGAVVKMGVTHQTTLNLLGETVEPWLLKGEVYDDEEMLEKLWAVDDLNTIFITYHHRVYLAYHFGKYTRALEGLNFLEEFLENGLSSAFIPIYYFYDSLTRLAIYEDSKEKKNIRKRVKSNQKKLEEFAEHAPGNISHKYYIVEAELAWIEGRDGDAREYYDKAITLVRDSDKFVNEEALANELAAKFYFSRNRANIGNFYLYNAYYGYKRWGALSKAKQLEEEYPTCKEFESTPLTALRPSTTTIGTRSTSSATQLLDINTIIKASRAIFGEIEMKKLLYKLITITIENAGAQKAILILKNDDGELRIQAEGTVDSDEVEAMQDQPIDKSENLSPAILRYVAKKEENLVLDNAAEEGIFTSDPYIMEKKPKSLLCMPMIEQKKLIGLLYLENNITTGAFTEARLEVLKVLSSQITISIKNATLIQNLREQERLQREMEIAERIQTSILPEVPDFDELEISATMKPAEEVGGDYYDIIFNSSDNCWISIGDVSGHGVTPGLIMIMAQSSLYSSIKDGMLTPKDAIIKVNKLLTENIRHRLKEDHFMSLSVLKYEGNGKFVHSGLHLDIIIYRNRTKKCERINTKGIFLGVLPDVSHLAEDLEFNLEIDDILVLYTDGIIESMNENRVQFEPEGLIEVVESNAEKSLEELTETIVAETLDWCHDKQLDDITLVLAKRRK